MNQYGTYTYSSPIVEKILSYSCTKIIGKSVFNFMPSDEGNRVSTLFKEHLENKLPQAKRNNEKIAFLYIDLHGFKFVNDDMSHLGR